MGIVLRKKGETAKAIEEFQKENSLCSNDADLHFNLALAYKDRGLLDEAKTSAEDDITNMLVAALGDDCRVQYTWKETEA